MPGQEVRSWPGIFYWADPRSKSMDSLNYIDLLGYYRYYSYYIGMTLLCGVNGLEGGIE